MKTKTLGRRILAVLLTLSLFLTTAPLTALPVSAAENDDQLIDVEVYLAECLAGVAQGDDTLAVQQCRTQYEFYTAEDLHSPTQEYLQSMTENTKLMALYGAWMAYSFQTTPSAALNRIVMAEDYYESLLLAMLKKGLEEQSDLQKLFNNKALNASNDMVSELCNITAAANAAELAEKLDKLSPEAYESITQTIEDTYPVGTASKVVGKVSLFLETGKNVVDAVERLSTYAALVELDESAKQWLEQMAAACNESTPAELQTAINNLKNASISFSDAALVNLQETTFSIVNWGASAAVDAALMAAAATNPVTQAVYIGLQAGNTICDIFFNSEEVGEQLYLLTCIQHVQALARRTVKNCEAAFLGDRTTVRAQAFRYALDCYLEAIVNLDVDSMLKFLDALYNGGFLSGSLSWLYGSPEDYQEIVNIYEDFREARIAGTENINRFAYLALEINYPMTYAYYFLMQTEGLEYRVLSETDKTCEITGYTGSAARLMIPSQIDGYTVTRIGDNAFSDCDTLTEVILGDSVTSIGNYAFSNCQNLTSVVIGDHVTAIEDHAFESCALLKSITIPDSVTTLGKFVFLNCMSLESIQLGSGVTSIYGAEGSENTVVGTTALDIFLGCLSLKSITVSPENPVYCSEDGVLFNKSKTRLIFYPFAKRDKEYTVPKGVKQLGIYSFYGCVFLEKLLISEGVEIIEYRAIVRAFSLETIEIPKSVVNIGGFAVQIENDEYAYEAFLENFSLKEINVSPDNPVYSSDNGVLFSKDKTRLITYPAGKTAAAFEIPNGVKTIDPEAFVYAAGFYQTDSEKPSLSDLEGLPEGLKEIYSVMLDKMYYSSSALTNLVIPDSVTNIGDGAFAYCESLTSVTIPDSVTNIGHSAFFGCNNNLKFYGYRGSYAETYAAENNILFVALTSVADAETGVAIENTASGALPENTELVVEQVEATDTGVIFDITLLQNGETVQPTGEVTVKIPVPNGLDGEQCRVYREEADGTYTDMNAVYQNGCMVFTTDHFSVYILTTEEPTSVTLGDVNGDGTIDAADAVMIQRYDSGLTTLTDEQLAAADVNADGLVDAADAVKIQRYDAGLIAEL